MPGPARVQVTFDKPLIPGALQHTNWNARFGNDVYAGAPGATAAGSIVTVPMTVVFVDIGPDVVTYNAAVPDVISTHGIPAAPFTNFPIT